MRCILPIGSHWSFDSFGPPFGVWPALEVWPEVCLEAETVQWALESCSWGGVCQLGWSWAVKTAVETPLDRKLVGPLEPHFKAPTERESTAPAVGPNYSETRIFLCDLEFGDSYQSVTQSQRYMILAHTYVFGEWVGFFSAVFDWEENPSWLLTSIDYRGPTHRSVPAGPLSECHCGLFVGSGEIPIWGLHWEENSRFLWPEIC